MEAPTVSTRLRHSRICTGKLLVFTYNYQNGLGSPCLWDTSLLRWSDCHSGTQQVHSLKLLPCQFKKEQDLLAMILLKRAPSFEVFSLSFYRKVKFHGISWLLQVPPKIWQSFCSDDSSGKGTSISEMDRSLLITLHFTTQHLICK